MLNGKTPNPKIQIPKFVAGIIVLAVLGLAYWVLSIVRTPEDEAWKRVQEHGVITIATDASFPPFAAVDGNGNLFGFDIDLAEEMARRLGVRAEFENIAYDALLSTLVANRDDAVISAFVPQPTRLKEVSYTRPYFVAGTVAVVRNGEMQNELMNNEEVMQWVVGKVVAVEYGAGGDALARQWAKRLMGLTVNPLPTATDAMQAVADNQADAALIDAITAYEFLREHPTLKLAGPPLEPEPYVIAVNVDSKDLFHALEKTLGEMEADGTLAELKMKWFGKASK